MLNPYESLARWPHGLCARRVIAEAKLRSQWSVMGWVTKMYYLKLFLASEGTLNPWSRLHLQSSAGADAAGGVGTPVSRRVDVRQAAGCKNNCRILSQNDEKMYQPHSVDNLVNPNE
jgi:hypothetical protein